MQEQGEGNKTGEKRERGREGERRRSEARIKGGRMVSGE
jgi:hypothetical protein